MNNDTDLMEAEAVPVPDFLTLSPDDAARAELVVGLRKAALFIETHPRVDIYPLMEVVITVHGTDTVEGARKVALALSPCKKVYDDTFIRLRHECGGNVVLQSVIWRSKVCSKVVVGKKLVPKKVIPAQSEVVIEEHEEDVTEWDCNTPPANDEMRQAIEAPESAMELPF